MSEMPVRLFVCACLLLGGAVAGGLGFAVAAAPSAITDVLPVPASPQLLGPIEEAGRTGWACVPEKMAEAQGWKDAHLPVGTTK